MERKLKPDKCPKCSSGAGSRPLSHLSDGHVVLHVVVILQENKDGQEVSKGSKMSTDSFEITMKREDVVRLTTVTRNGHVLRYGAAAARQTDRKGKRD